MCILVLYITNLFRLISKFLFLCNIINLSTIECYILIFYDLLIIVIIQLLSPFYFQFLKMKKWLVFAIILIASVVLFRPTESCNKAICASVVSKCMLTQSCKCDLKDCSCCKECFSCLSYLYSECCSCVDMCPKPNETNNVLSKKSHIEDFHDSIPGLFKALTSDPDPLQRWLTFTFPVDFDQSPYRIQHEKEEYYLRK